LLKYRNAHGSHIYIRPSGEHHFTSLDDLNETSLARLSADGFTPCAVVETSAGNFQAWLKHTRVFPKLLSTFAAQTLAVRYDADPSAADWRRFGRPPASPTANPSIERRMVSSHSCGSRVTVASSFRWPKSSRRKSPSFMKSESRSEKRDAYWRRFLSKRGPRLSNLSLERFRTSTKYLDRPAAADIAFCVAAFANGMTEDRIERALVDDYLSRDPSPSKRAAYIRRTMERARRWAER
jgi:hypothetical protein